MNSEELEMSLRTEFEEQLKNVFAEMRQEIADLQEKVETEFEKHKSQLSEVFRDFSARVETEKELDAGFTDSVVEHLRLARDEGARITATAIAEAEEMQQAQAAEEAAQAKPSVGISDLRDAINDISNQTSQSSILKALVSHAEKFTTRGAFFILKNDHFVGWRVFGSSQEEADEQTVREIFLPVSAETVLGESLRSLSAVESSYGTYAGDSTYLDKLGFGQPEQMFAIPLVARGRGVAVLYADNGEQNETVNVEALETLVRVAGLTVEVIASSPAGSPKSYEAPQMQTYSNSAASAQPQKEADEVEAETDYQTAEAEAETDYQTDDYQAAEKSSEVGAAESYQPETQLADSQPAADFSSSYTEDEVETSDETNYQSPGDDFAFQATQQSEPEISASDDFEVEVIQDEDEAENQEFHFAREEQPEEAQTALGEQTESADENYSWNMPAAAESFSTGAEDRNESYETRFEPSSTENVSASEDFSASAANDYQFENNQYESGQSLDSPQIQFEEIEAFDNSQFESAEKPVPQMEDFSFAAEENFDSPKLEDDKSDDSFVAPAAETVSQPVATPPIKSRFSDRNVDLPIEVSEDERRLHNDARRFARLLVSEIKLYNEQKVKEGRDAHDLYERLREAIDRSREMYDKRVQPPVAAKFDYFHYELVSTLAEGEQAKLGRSYQGATL